MRIIYFDNAATTFKKPPVVLRKTLKYLKKGYGNAGRSGHFISIETAEIIYKTRERLSRILNYPSPDNIVFFHNVTQALNVAIKTCIPEGSHVITSHLEHNSVLRPLYSLQAEEKITLSFFSHKGDIEKNIEQLMRENTSAIVSTLVSNVTGEEIPLSVLTNIRKKHGILLIVDGSQMFAHKRIDLTENEVDVFCSAGHKGAFAMQGVGFGIFRIPPGKTLIEGGSGTDTFSHNMPRYLPERLEAGTLSAPAIASLFFGLEFIEEYGIGNIEKKLLFFDTLIDEGLKNNKKVRCLADGKHGIHSFVFNDEMSSATTRKLEQYNILVRGGYHCAPLAHEFYSTNNTGAVRLSLSVMNNEKEIIRFLSALKKI